MTTLTETYGTTTRSTVPGTGGGDEFVMLNMDALALDQNLSPSPRGGARDDDISVDTTLIARSVGSVVKRQNNAFLRSLTIRVSNNNEYKKFNEGGGEKYAPASDFQWDITFADPVSVRRMPSSSVPVLSTSTTSSSWGSKMIQKANKVNLSIGKKKHKHSITISSIEGHAALSRIAVGDVVTKINGKKIGPSYNAQRCSDLVHKICSGENSSNISNSNNSSNTTFVSIQTGNENGLDTVLEATVLKPHPGATAMDLGLEVWWWRGLCVRAVKPNSMFEHSGLKIDDELESINGISLTYNDKVTANDFNRIFEEELPFEVTIVVKRCKHRYSGEFE